MSEPAEELAARLDELARTPILLVAVDFDGTLAPIAADPASAVADPAAMASLRALADLPQSYASILSGRALSDLARRAPGIPKLVLIGSHGGEVAPGGLVPLAEEQTRLLDRLHSAANQRASDLAGARVERKPAGVAFHFRGCDPAKADLAASALRAELAPLESVHVRDGKKVLEFSVIDANKGKALAHLRRRVGATGVLLLGDDVTDEDAFAVLAPTDVGVKVGEGATTAKLRVAEPADVVGALARLLQKRREFLDSVRAVPIEHHALISDQRSLALVTSDGRIVWTCLPRLDAPALFAELLGGPAHGFFEVRPLAGGAASPRYVGDTMLLETKWPTFKVVDYLDASAGRAFQRAGRSDLLRVVEGRGRVRIVFAPRVDFGRSPTRIRVADGGLVVEGVRDACVLRAPGVGFRIEPEGTHDTAVAELDLTAEPLVLELRYGTHSLAPAPEPEPKRRTRTEQVWSAWARTLTLPNTARELVLRSAVVLRALTHGPTGAIAAAATTSLPEQIGGVRNWDYRLCWPRDASIAALALARLGASGPGMKLCDWMLGILDRADPGTVLAPVYTVTGGHVGTEGELSELAGYRGSRPVRVGNAAAQQLQLDVFGPIVDLLAGLARIGAPLSAEHWRMVESILEMVRLHWQKPDHGIWEIRGPLQHHVHTKVMCWLAVDRACHLGAYLGRDCADWSRLRSEIAAEIAALGPRSSDGSFGATYGSAEADAAALWVGLSGLLAPDDRRFVATVERVERELRQGSTVYRYRYDDALPGVEGGFHLCTTWLIRAYARLGRMDAANELFARYTALAGPLGLFAEEYDPVNGVSLGNYPQSYSLAGLIDAAIELDGGTAAPR